MPIPLTIVERLRRLQRLFQKMDEPTLDRLTARWEAAGLRVGFAFTLDDQTPEVREQVRKKMDASPDGHFSVDITDTDQYLVPSGLQSPEDEDVLDEMERDVLAAIDYAPGVEDLVERILVGTDKIDKLPEPSFQLLIEDVQRLSSKGEIEGYPRERLAAVKSALQRSGRRLDELREATLRRITAEQMGAIMAGVEAFKAHVAEHPGGPASWPDLERWSDLLKDYLHNGVYDDADLRALAAALKAGDLPQSAEAVRGFLTDYAPGVHNLRDRVIAGVQPSRYIALTDRQRGRWEEDLRQFEREMRLHQWTRQDGVDVITAIAKVDDRMVEAVGDNLTRIKDAYASGPAHLVALEQQFLALRVNAMIEGALPGLPGALQPATIKALKHATPYCWSQECVEAVASAGAKLPTTQHPSAHALGPVAGPGAAGWWWFERPIPVQTVSSGSPVVALLWRREVHDGSPEWIHAATGKPNRRKIEPGMLTWFSCFIHEEIEIAGRTQVVPIPTAAWPWPDGWSLAEFLEHASESYLRLEQTGAYGADAAGLDVTIKATEWFSRLWLAGGMWLEQKVLARMPHRVPRQPGRALARKHGLEAPPLVEVVHLRRYERWQGGESGEHRTVDWKWRWDVTGHWRNQWHPKTGRHEATWVRGYVKGPEDRPFKSTVKIYAVVR